jgi:hypothetical protein
MPLSEKSRLDVKAWKGHRKRFQRESLGRRALTLFLLCGGSACLLGTGIPTTSGLVLLGGDTPSRVSQRTLTFAERVAYQYAIEEIYWRHRIWPEGNLGPKPPLDAIVSRRQIEQKVEDYFGKSQLVTGQRRWPITPSELQTEMERMASHSKQPEVLRELFDALDNDPFVIAECLARPALAERLSADLSLVPSVPAAPRNSFAAGTAASTEERIRVTTNLDDAAYKLPEISPPADCIDGAWTATTLFNAPDARESRPSVWTGVEMIIWGGVNSHGSLNTGGRYNPSTDTWTATSTSNAPIGRGSHTAVWTGIEMIVWGGYNNPAGELNTGGRYNPTTDTWTATSTANAPAARASHTAVWTGIEMIVWGGRNETFWMNTGGRYNPGTDSWTATSIMNAPSARWDHTALWTNSGMIIWVELLRRTICTLVANIIPARTVGRLRASRTYRLAESLTPQYGAVAK